jgi:hypothetical protein
MKPCRLKNSTFWEDIDFKPLLNNTPRGGTAYLAIKTMPRDDGFYYLANCLFLPP